MKLKRLNLVLLAIGLNFCSGCAINGQKIPFRDKFASLDFRKGDAGAASESGLSPEFLERRKSSRRIRKEHCLRGRDGRKMLANMEKHARNIVNF